MKKLALAEIKDILVGCTILGTGGGGSLEEGMAAVKAELDAGKEFRILDFDEISDDAWYANPYYCGCIVPEGELVQNYNNAISDSIKALEEYMDVSFEGFVSIEYGGGNTGEVMAACARTGKYIVDADAAGRAVPELQFSTYYVTGNSITPFAVGTPFGDTAVITHVKDDARAEALARHMAIGSGGTVGMTDHPVTGKKLKNAVIPGALSYAGTIGKAQRVAVENGDDPLEAIVNAGNGKLLFEGRVAAGTEWELKDGFTVGSIRIEGTGDYAGSKARIWYKNENMILWIDDTIKLTCPDLICTVDRNTGYPVTNPNWTEGMEIAVLGFPCHELWREASAMEILNPRFFGFETDCVFLE